MSYCACYINQFLNATLPRNAGTDEVETNNVKPVEEFYSNNLYENMKETAELFYSPSAFDLGPLPNFTDLENNTATKRAQARIFLAAFAESYKYRDVLNDACLYHVAKEVHDKMVHAWLATPERDSLEMEFNYRCRPYDTIDFVPALAESVFLLLAARTPNDPPVPGYDNMSTHEKADALMCATHDLLKRFNAKAQ